MRSAAPAAARDADGLRAILERFLESCRNPCLLEPGEELLPLAAGSYQIEVRQGRLTIQAWDSGRNVIRRVTAAGEARRGRLELTVERFARAPGKMFVLDLAHPESRKTTHRGERLVFRERFRRFLTREFPSWKLAEISAEADLEHSLSPAFPRALLRQGNTGAAAIAAPPGAVDAAFLLSFGLIWLDYLRRRERRIAIDRLVLFVPAEAAGPACHRAPLLDPARARCQIYAYSAADFARPLDPADHGNLETRLEVFRRPEPEARAWVERLARLPEVEIVPTNAGALSLRVHGIEFARTAGRELLFGLHKRAAARDYNLAEIERLAAELAALRAPRGAGPLSRQDPEEWLASQVRAGIERLDASLLPAPLYSQAPACLGGQRGVIDLLAVDRAGRLAVLELKASQDIHLPVQALDYWLRVKWHLDRGEFASHGYFPGVELRPDPPRLLLVSPALEYHPTTEAVLQFFAPEIEVERIGLAQNWREKLQVVFRLRGAERPG
jgi:hypothetical protein